MEFMVFLHDIKFILLCHSKQNITVQYSHDSSLSRLVPWALTAECVVVAHDFSAGTVINVFANNLNGATHGRFGVRWTPGCLNHILCFLVSQKLRNSLMETQLVAYVSSKNNNFMSFHYTFLHILMNWSLTTLFTQAKEQILSSWS